MRKIWEKHLNHWTNKSFIYSVIFAVALLFLSLYFNYLSGTYASAKISNGVTDIFLDNLPIVNVDFIFFTGPVLLVLFVGLIFLFDPQAIPFTLKSISLFTLIRAIFISLTHLGPYHGQLLTETNSLIQNFKLTFQGDYFFSGHTGLPFLLMLVFWRKIWLRIVFFATSLIFGAAVLLGHLHYSIDVFSAFFITYTIFELAKWLFSEDYSIFQGSLVNSL